MEGNDRPCVSRSGRPGDRLSLVLEVGNGGFGKLYNPRPVNVVLVDEATGAATRIEADGSASLEGDARYSIQMANAGTWQDADGTNDLGLQVVIGA